MANPSRAAASPSRSSSVTNGSVPGSPSAATIAAASWRASSARSGWVRHKRSAVDLTRTAGWTSAQAAAWAASRAVAAATPDESSAPSCKLEEERGRPFLGLDKHGIEREDEPADRARLAARELPDRGEDEVRTGRVAAARDRLKALEVGDVLGEERTIIRDRGREHLGVGHPFEVVVRVVDRNDIVATRPELFGQGGGVHLVEQQPHPRMRRSRSSVRSSRSASSSTSAMKRSTSSRYSA